MSNLFLDGNDGIEKRLSYPQKEIESADRETLLEYAIGIKPVKDYWIDKVCVDGVFPATQLHFRIDRQIEPELKEKITEAIKIHGMGFVDVHIFSRRIILTTTCGANDREYWARRIARAINDVLNTFGIVADQDT